MWTIWFEIKHGKLLHMVIKHQGLSACISDITMSCYRHRVIPMFIASIVVAPISMCAECWLGELPKVYSHEIPVYLLDCG